MYEFMNLYMNTFIYESNKSNSLASNLFEVKSRTFYVINL